MNSKYTQNINPIIFNKKLNDKFNVIPFNTTSNTLGLTKNSYPASKEWYNSVYSYNNNYIKNLSIADKNFSKLIKSYFNLYFKSKTLKSTRISTRFRRLLMNKVFVSRAEIKHTSSKVLITLYVFNQQKRDLIKKIKIIENLLFPSKNMYQRPLSLEEKLIIIKNKKYNVSTSDWERKLQISLYKLIGKEKEILSIAKGLELNKTKFIVLENSNKRLKYLMYLLSTCKEDFNFYNNYYRIYGEIIHKANLEREIMSIAYYKLLLNLNKFKFEDKFLIKLKPLLIKTYNKEVEFNILNLKTLYLNSDIFTEAISLKLKNRNNSLLRVLKTSLSMVKLPRVNKIRENFYKVNIKELWVNKVKNFSIDLIINRFNNSSDNIKKDIFNKMFLDVFPNSSFLIKENKQDNKLSNFVLNTLKHKKMAGVRLEAKGRLTRRFTASRSVFKIKWKGSLKNIDSSYRGVSSAILRGNLKSNVQYSLVKSKTRNGSFGLRGWISGK